MRGDEFLDKMELVDPAYVEAADAPPKKKKRAQTKWKKHAWIKWAAAAACPCLLAAAVLFYFRPEMSSNVEAPVPTEEHPSVAEKEPFGQEKDTSDSEKDISGQKKDASDPGEGESPAFAAKTSDTYATLPELLAYLSTHESHDSLYAGEGNQIPAASDEPEEASESGLIENTGVAVSRDENYSYHIGIDAVYISRLDGKDTQNVGSIDTRADAIFACRDHLLVISQSYGDEPDFMFSVSVDIYDISVPNKPALKEKYIQLGELSSCWMVDGELFLATGDGQCACGWSRTDDLSQYYPSLQHNGEAVEWADEEISILGEPTRVQYSAITAIDGNSGQIVRKKAIYGDIWNLFYGEGWVAASVFGETLTYQENPALYTFGSDLGFTGKISTAEIMGAPEKNDSKDGMPQDGSYVHITSVSNYEGVYRLLGTFSKREEDSAERYLMAIAANPQTGEAKSQLLQTGTQYPYEEFTEILWEENRAITCIGMGLLETKFLFVAFDGLTVTFQETELKADYLDRQVGVVYGNPLGNFESLIPMGGGIYVRYSLPTEGPCGFDVFDFSDSAAPRLLYRTDEPLSGQDVFDYTWHVYDDHTFGTLKVILGNREDPSRNVKLAWCIYSIEDGSEMAITLQEEHPLDGEVATFTGAGYLGFATFEAGGNLYYITEETESAAVL